jgi:GT2 family glycosyltransferase
MCKKSITIVIPTYRRGTTVLESVRALLALDPPANEILLVDQTPQHSVEIERKLDELQRTIREASHA